MRAAKVLVSVAFVQACHSLCYCKMQYLPKSQFLTKIAYHFSSRVKTFEMILYNINYKSISRVKMTANLRKVIQSVKGQYRKITHQKEQFLQISYFPLVILVLTIFTPLSLI